MHSVPLLRKFSSTLVSQLVEGVTSGFAPVIKIIVGTRKLLSKMQQMFGTECDIIEAVEEVHYFQ